MENGYYPFNDFHAIVALVGAGDFSSASAVLMDLENATPLSRCAQLANKVGIHASRAIIAFGQERYDEVIELLRPLRPIANRFGGSHAQRDILSLTLFEASVKRRNFDYARNLLHERHSHKPISLFGRRLHKKLAKPSKKAA